LFEDSRNCNVSTDKARVALEGVDDLVVVRRKKADRSADRKLPSFKAGFPWQTGRSRLRSQHLRALGTDLMFAK
jgi:hypothetical protein